MIHAHPIQNTSAADPISDSIFRSVRLGTCCGTPMKTTITARRFFTCGHCGAVDLGSKHFTAAQWHCLVERVQ